MKNNWECLRKIVLKKVWEYYGEKKVKILGNRGDIMRKNLEKVLRKIWESCNEKNFTQKIIGIKLKKKF